MSHLSFMYERDIFSSIRYVVKYQGNVEHPFIFLLFIQHYVNTRLSAPQSREYNEPDRWILAIEELYFSVGHRK